MFKSPKVGYIVLSIFLFGSYLGKAQVNLNKYKYVVVPKKFEDFKTENQHQTNTLVKYLFTKKGFTTVWDDGLPEDLANNQCRALFVSLRNKSSMFSTKTSVVLKDCNKQEVFTSVEGKSKQKNYKKSYNEAITAAMESFDGLNYQYVGDDQATEPITVSFKNDVKKLPDSEKTSTSEKQNEKVIVQEATTEKQTYKNNEPVESNFKKAKKSDPVVEQIATTEEQVYETTEPIESHIKKTDEVKTEQVVKSTKIENTSVLYAQEITNGYQLVDSTPRVVLKILKTSMVDHYLAKGDKGNGMVYSKNGKWYFERYEGENLVAEELNIKF